MGSPTLITKNHYHCSSMCLTLSASPRQRILEAATHASLMVHSVAVASKLSSAACIERCLFCLVPHSPTEQVLREAMIADS